MGLDNMFSGFCQIFLDKIKKILSNKSSLIKYNSSFVNMPNRGGVKNAEIKNSKMHPFHSILFLTGVRAGFFLEKTPQTPKPAGRFEVQKVITTLKKPPCQVASSFWEYSF